MKIYIVFKAYWMYSSNIDSIYINESNAKERRDEILKSSSDARSYIETYETKDSLPFKTINEYREFIHNQCDGHLKE